MYNAGRGETPGTLWNCGRSRTPRLSPRTPRLFFNPKQLGNLSAPLSLAKPNPRASLRLCSARLQCVFVPNSTQHLLYGWEATTNFNYVVPDEEGRLFKTRYAAHGPLVPPATLKSSWHFRACLGRNRMRERHGTMGSLKGGQSAAMDPTNEHSDRGVYT